MSEEQKKEFETVIEQMRQMPPERQTLCTGFVMGVNATAKLKPKQEETANEP